MPYMTTAEVAKATRDAIKAARKAGQLGDIPADVTISVTSRDSLAITVKNAPAEWAWTGERGTHTERPSAAVRELAGKLADLARPFHAKGYDFGFVYLDGGVVLAGLGKPGWTPGQD